MLGSTWKFRNADGKFVPARMAAGLVSFSRQIDVGDLIHSEFTSGVAAYVYDNYFTVVLDNASALLTTVSAVLPAQPARRYVVSSLAVSAGGLNTNGFSDYIINGGSQLFRMFLNTDSQFYFGETLTNLTLVGDVNNALSISMQKEDSTNSFSVSGHLVDG